MINAADDRCDLAVKALAVKAFVQSATIAIYAAHIARNGSEANQACREGSVKEAEKLATVLSQRGWL